MNESDLDKPVITDLSLLALNDEMKNAPQNHATLEVKGKIVTFRMSREELDGILANEKSGDKFRLCGEVNNIDEMFSLGDLREATRNKLEDTFDQIQHD